MARRRRLDAPGALHHVCGRGVAKRTIADTRRERRFFLSLLARLVRRRALDVLAYSLMGNHYHLLVRSVDGALSTAMQWALSIHVRRFNRRRDRDGPLFKSRFWSRPIESRQDTVHVARYIDQNPVAAGIVARAAEFEFGSASHYARPHGPPWLERATLEGLACEWVGALTVKPESYAQAFDDRPSPGLAWVVERRIEQPCETRPGLGEGAGVGAASAWLLRDLDGEDVPCAHVLAFPDHVLAEVDARAGDGAASAAMAAGLLRSACGFTSCEIATRLATTPQRASRLLRRHARLLRESDDYRRTAGAALHASIAAL